jgi:hypothetical protein
MLHAFEDELLSPKNKRTHCLSLLCTSGLGSRFKQRGGNVVNDNEMKLILDVHFKRISLFHGASLSFSGGFVFANAYSSSKYERQMCVMVSE